MASSWFSFFSYHIAARSNKHHISYIFSRNFVLCTNVAITYLEHSQQNSILKSLGGGGHIAAYSRI